MNRRRFLTCATTFPLAATLGIGAKRGSLTRRRGRASAQPPPTGADADRAVTLFLCGDVMTGRGIDQVLPYPSEPRLFEPYMRSARGYVALAERKNGPIPHPVEWPYVWGDALVELDRISPDARIINLETSVTTSDSHLSGKRIHYRMHPENVPVLTAAEIDGCVLANNHILDWGPAGLRESLHALEVAGIHTAGAGLDSRQAGSPAILKTGKGHRVLVFGFATTTSGIPKEWAARPDRPGINLLENLSSETVRGIASQVRSVKSDGDIVVASIHWGANWGYDVPARQREFAHQLVDHADVDVVHGHSSHHFKGIEVHRDRPILYGCGDFLNDYEGISGREEYRSELVLMYFPVMGVSDRKLVRFGLSPMRIERFRLNRPATEELEWVRETLNRECERFGTRVDAGPHRTLALTWD